jgi:hypothetical protein
MDTNDQESILNDEDDYFAHMDIIINAPDQRNEK